MKNTQESLDELNEAFEVSTAFFKSENLEDLSKKYLTEKALGALSKRGKNLIEEWNEQLTKEQAEEYFPQNGPMHGQESYIRKVSVCQFFTVQVRKDKIEDGVKAIAEVINELAELGAIYSCLAPISSIDLATIMFEVQSSMVFCYVHIKSEHQEYAKTLKYNTVEGGIGPRLHDLSIELKPGEFLADGHIFIPTQIVDKNGCTLTEEALIYQKINEYLKYLPEGTKFVSYRKCTFTDPSISFPIELKFYNELFQNITRVQHEYIRSCAVVNDQLKQFNLFLQMRYWGIDPITKEKNVELYPFIFG